MEGGIELGDVLAYDQVANIHGIMHVGVVIDVDRVAHCIQRRGVGYVRVDTFLDFAKEAKARQLYVLKHRGKPAIHIDEVRTRVAARMGPRRFDVLTSNCEHFVAEVTGNPMHHTSAVVGVHILMMMMIVVTGLVATGVVLFQQKK